MPLIYITGVSGTGKSAALRELRYRGYRAFGVDEDSFGDWVNRENGNIEDIDAAGASEDFSIHTWYKDHSWELSRKRISQLAKESEGRAFLCGTADNFNGVKEYFDAVFALITEDPDTLRQRILDRTDVDFGKDPDEMKRILEWQSGAPAFYSAMGATLVDSSGDIKEVVDSILEQL